MTLDARVNGVYCCKAIVDCGATSSVNSENLVNRLNLDIDKTQRRVALVADGQTSDILGNVEMNIAIKGHETTITPAVMPKLPFDMLLGLDWMAKAGVCIKIKDEQCDVSVGDMILGVRIEQEDEVISAKDVTLEPRTAHVIAVTLINIPLGPVVIE